MTLSPFDAPAFSRDIPSYTSGHTCLSGRVGMIFKHKWRSHECLKNILTHPLRHTWPEVYEGISREKAGASNGLKVGTK